MSNSPSGYALKRSQSQEAQADPASRSQETRRLIVEAARDCMLENGYVATRIEDIINRAGISRPTFYRHFQDKFEVARAVHAIARGEAMEPWGALSDRDFRDPAAIRDWLEDLYRSHQERRSEIVVWSEMNAAEPGYVLRMPRQMPGIVARLAQTIPAFARAEREAPAADLLEGGRPGPVWVDAYMLIDQIGYSLSTHVLGSQLLSLDDILACFADRMLQFIERYDENRGSG